jgi:hypothetical protein
MIFEPVAKLMHHQHLLTFSATVSRFYEYPIIIVTLLTSAKQPNGTARHLLMETWKHLGCR